MDPNQPPDPNNPTPLNPLPVQPSAGGITIDSMITAPVTTGDQMPPVMPEAQTPLNPLPFQPEIAQPQLQQDPTPSSGGRGKKKLIIIASSVIFALLVAGGAGYVLGFYLPNRPENVWKTGVARTGEAVDRIITASTEKGKLDQYKKSQISGDLQFKDADGKFVGKFDIKFDDTKANLDTSFNYENSLGEKVDISGKLLAELVEGSNFPNMYLQLSGFAPLGFDAILPGISDLDGRWIAIEEPFLKSLNLTLPEGNINENSITSDDTAAFVRTISATSNKYLFSTTPETGIFEMTKFVAKETLEDGMEAYRYEVKINDKNAITYCKDLVENLFESELYKKLPNFNPDSIKVDKNYSLEQCDEAWGGSLKKLTTYDVWLDTKYKLFHKIRIKDADDNKAYTEIGQIYKGGDDISLFVRDYKNDQPNGSLTINTNLNTNTTNAELEFSDEGSTIVMTMEAKLYDGAIDVSKPLDAVQIEEIFAAFGITDPAALFGGVAAPTEDSSNLGGQAGDEQVYVLGEQTVPEPTPSTTSPFDTPNLFRSIF